MNAKKMIMMGLALVAMAASAQEVEEPGALKNARTQYEKDLKVAQDNVSRGYMQKLEVLYSSLRDRKDKMVIAKEIEEIKAGLSDSLLKSDPIVGTWTYSDKTSTVFMADGTGTHSNGWNGVWKRIKAGAYEVVWNNDGKKNYYTILSGGKTIKIANPDGFKCSGNRKGE